MKKDCPKAEAIRGHRCSKCGKQGHLEKFCRGESTDGRSQATMKKPVKATQRSDKGTKSSSNKSARRQKVIKEALARLMTLEDDEDEDIQRNGADSDEEEGDVEDTEDVFLLH